MMKSPCMQCRRVAEPMACEDKQCLVWQAWFSGRWEQLRRQTRVHMEQVKTQPAGVCIGGTYYSLPHQVKRYLDTDPCDGCLCAEELCDAPCPRKRSWLQAKENAKCRMQNAK